MAKLTVLPEQAIISGFKGTIDYYEYMGIPVARKWPRSPGKRRSPAVEAQWQTFQDAASLWFQLDQEIRDYYNQLASGTGMTGRDMFTRGYISGLYRYPHDVEEEMITYYTARAHKAAAPQTIAHETDTKVTFDTRDWDSHNCFYLVNDRFVVKEAGKYLCNALAFWTTPVANKIYAIGIRKNNAWHTIHRVIPAAADIFSTEVTSIVECAVDDYLEVFVWQNSGGADDIAEGSDNTCFEIHRLS